MKILLFTDNLGAGGAQRQLVGLAVLLAQSGYSVKVCTYQDINFYKGYLDDNGVENEIIAGASSRFFRIPCVAKYFKKEGPDCVISYQEMPSLISCIAKFLGCSAKLFVSERSVTQRLTFKDRVRFNLYRLANWVVPNSYSQECFLKRHYGWMSEKIHTITNFVDLDFFSLKIKERRDTPVILVAASVWPPKNVLGLIRAVKVLVDRGNSFKIEWYGLVNGHEMYVNECKKLIQDLEIGAYIELLPKTKDIINQYRNCDYFCLPSFYEGTPNVICEAMSVGRPVICSDVCDNSIYVKNSVNGYLFNPSDSNDIANAIEHALQLSSDEYLTMCQQSRRMAEKLLSKEVFINKYLKILNR